jgi:hypothetical protein
MNHLQGKFMLSDIPNQDLQVNQVSSTDEHFFENTAQLQDITIERCPHDKENPYTMVNRDLIRDNTISPECRWLLIYLLSNNDKWKFKPCQLVKYLQPHMGRTKVYALIDEAVEAGYIRKEDILSDTKRGGKIKSGTRYFVSEFPKFKKVLRRSSFRHTGDRHAGSADGKNNIDKKEHREEIPTSSLEVPIEQAPIVAAREEVFPPDKPKRTKSDFSHQVRDVATKMLAIIEKHHPVYRPPADLTKFLLAVQVMIEKDKQDPKLLLETFEWGIADNELRGDFNGWQGILATNNKGGKSTNPAEIFHKHYSKIHSQMRSKPKTKASEVDRRLKDKQGNAVDEYKDLMF